ncbi:MAG: ATP-dependent Clp protease ATP-binding subunit [Candidatus Pacebacteria bacterium]|nr:ATP-dependent Clp protease ATP-binding subunit [Candidatus Paceibacterota bacterium]
MKKTKINRGITTKFFLYLFKTLRVIFFFAFLIAVFYFIYGFMADNFPLELAEPILFSAFFSFSCFLLFFNLAFFFDDALRRSKVINGDIENNDINLADFLSINAATRVKKAINFAKKKKIEVNSSILLYFLLNNKNRKIDFILNRLLISKKLLLSRAKESMLYTKDINEGTGLSYDLTSIILEAAKASIRRKGFYIKTADILSALSKIEPNFKELLRRSKLKKEDIDNINYWQEHLLRRVSENKKWWHKDNLSKFGSVARDWACGFTPTLDKYSTDLTELVQRLGFVEIIGHENERAQVERILIRDNDNNVLLVGDDGVGRFSIVRAIAERSYLNQSLPELNNKRFVEIDMNSILTSSSTIDEVEIILDTCLREASCAGNVILVLSNFDNYLSDGNIAAKADISSLIAPYLKFSEFKFIAVTSYNGLHKYIERKPQILSFFEKIEVKESSKDETILILEREIPFLECKYNIFITYPAILKIIELCDKYIHDNPFPKKAITLLNDVCVYANSKKEKIVLDKHVEEIISEKTEIPVGKITADERDTLLNLEDLIHKRIINQVEAVNEVAASLRRARSGIKTKNGPMGSFLFLGPTGVGKTETAKALAEVYFGSETKMIRFDMSEFQTVEDVKRFIGDGNNPGLLTTDVQENPFSLILFDEIEKAHPNILNLFLQVLDEGIITDSMGRKIDFSNTIIISTSNAGYQIILNAIKENKPMDSIKQDILDYVFKQGLFRPEFINRFDATVIFKALTKENLLQIAELRFKKLQQNLLRKQINLNVPHKVKMQIVELSYNPEFGAREMRRVIQDKVENALAKAFLANQIKEGDTISINENFEITVLKRDYEE